MVRFMVCDTDKEFLSNLAEFLHNEYDPCSVEYMYGPTALEMSLRADSGGGDVLLTEIELRDENAINIIGKYLKNSSSLQVIYMTSKVDYCTEVYDTRHSGFLLKPIRRELLKHNINRALKQLEERKECGIVIQKGSNIHIINTPSVLYLESRARIVKVVTDEESLEAYGKLDHYFRYLDKRFVQCHKSYIVNMERIKKYCGDSFIMENNISVPISQSKRKEIRQQFLKYIGDV